MEHLKKGEEMPQGEKGGGRRAQRAGPVLIIWTLPLQAGMESDIGQESLLEE